MAEREYLGIIRSDQDVIEAFKKIDHDLGLNGSSTVQLTPAANMNQQIAARLDEIQTNPDVVAFVAGGTAIAQTLMMRMSVPAPNGSYVRVTRSNGADTIRIDFPNEIQPHMAGTLLRSATKHLPGFEASVSLQKIVGAEVQEFYRRREVSLLRLEELSQRLIEQNEEYRRVLDLELAADRKKVEAEKQLFLEKLNAEYEAKNNSIVQRSDALEQRSKDLDDRGSRHVRREIRKEFLQKLASREKQFQLSESTNKKRFVIHLQFCALLAVAIGFALFGLWEVASQPKDLTAYIRLVLGIVGTASAAVYYIRWTDQWFRQHVDEEFRLQRLGLDFERASWVVEMALEWKDEKGQEIPRELIDRLTANLFLSGAISQASRHPVEDVTSALLGSASSLKLNLPGGGGELNIDRKGIKNLT